jgi:hypothetical protein
MSSNAGRVSTSATSWVLAIWWTSPLWSTKKCGDAMPRSLKYRCMAATV